MYALSPSLTRLEVATIHVSSRGRDHTAIIDRFQFDVGTLRESDGKNPDCNFAEDLV